MPVLAAPVQQPLRFLLAQHLNATSAFVPLSSPAHGAHAGWPRRAGPPGALHQRSDLVVGTVSDKTCRSLGIAAERAARAPRRAVRRRASFRRPQALGSCRPFSSCPRRPRLSQPPTQGYARYRSQVGSRDMLLCGARSGASPRRRSALAPLPLSCRGWRYADHARLARNQLADHDRLAARQPAPQAVDDTVVVRSLPMRTIAKLNASPLESCCAYSS